MLIVLPPLLLLHPPLYPDVPIIDWMLDLNLNAQYIFTSSSFYLVLSQFDLLPRIFEQFILLLRRVRQNPSHLLIQLDVSPSGFSETELACLVSMMTRIKHVQTLYLPLSCPPIHCQPTNLPLPTYNFHLKTIIIFFLPFSTLIYFLNSTSSHLACLADPILAPTIVFFLLFTCTNGLPPSFPQADSSQSLANPCRQSTCTQAGLCTQKGQMQFQTPLFFTCNTHLLNKSITSERFLMPIFPYSFPHSFLPLLLALHLFIFSLRGKYIAKDLETCKINMCFFSQKFFYEIMSLMILCQKVFHICVKSFIYVLQRFLWLKVNFQQKSTGLGTLVLQSLTGGHTSVHLPTKSWGPCDLTCPWDML
ncbi:putative signal peptide protein [Puccinia sorghi]|uniref:Putative signal peptide protein n=1 Tax=Puccinia sorghi TaxID=27349 RepID=A0A0L6UJM3_9BASI|nr:putative signal peptide protein [Puccinia sorghi]